MVGYGTVTAKYQENVKTDNDRKYIYVSAIVALSFVGAVFIIAHGTSMRSETTVLAEAEPVPGKLDTLGVGVDSWPWEKKVQPKPAARGSVHKDDLVREIMADFGDTTHFNPMYKAPRARRTTTLEAELVGKAQEDLPKRLGRLPIDTCSEDTPNCNKLRLQTAIKIDGWPWDKPETNITEPAAAADEDEAGAEEAAKPTMLRRVAAAGFRAALGAARLRQSLAADSRAVAMLAARGATPAEEEVAAQALQRDAFLMSESEASSERRVQQSLKSIFGLDKTGVSCSRALGGCNVSDVNASNATEAWDGWYWLPKDSGVIRDKGVNVDKWLLGAVKWERHAAQQLKTDAADMMRLADSDAASPNLRRSVSLGAKERSAWESRLAQQLSAYAARMASVQSLDSQDGCKCVGSTDEDKGPRCSCEGQPEIGSAADEFSRSEITSWD